MIRNSDRLSTRAVEVVLRHALHTLAVLRIIGQIEQMKIVQVEAGHGLGRPSGRWAARPAEDRAQQADDGRQHAVP